MAKIHQISTVAIDLDTAHERDFVPGRTGREGRWSQPDPGGMRRRSTAVLIASLRIIVTEYIKTGECGATWTQPTTSWWRRGS